MRVPLTVQHAPYGSAGLPSGDAIRINWKAQNEGEGAARFTSLEVKDVHKVIAPFDNLRSFYSGDEFRGQDFGRT